MMDEHDSGATRLDQEPGPGQTATEGKSFTARLGCLVDVLVRVHIQAHVQVHVHVHVPFHGTARREIEVEAW